MLLQYLFEVLDFSEESGWQVHPQSAFVELKTIQQILFQRPKRHKTINDVLAILQPLNELTIDFKFLKSVVDLAKCQFRQYFPRMVLLVKIQVWTQCLQSVHEDIHECLVDLVEVCQGVLPLLVIV